MSNEQSFTNLGKLRLLGITAMILSDNDPIFLGFQFGHPNIIALTP